MRRSFTIRSLLIATFLAALFFALPIRTAWNQKTGRQWVATQRGHIWFRHRIDPATGRYTIPYVPGLLVELLGVDVFNPVTGVTLDCETITTFQPISNLQTLECLDINIEMNEEIDFAPLKSLPRLKELHFSEWSCLTEEQLSELQSMLPRVTIYSEYSTTN